MIARRFSLLRQLAWAATLATGFGTLWFVVVLWLGTSIQEAWQGGHRPPQESLVVRSDGTLLIKSFRVDNPYLGATYRDLKGNVQEAPDRDDELPAVSMSGEPPRTGFAFSQLGWASRLMSFGNEREPTINWFFVHDGKPDGTGYFVAYERTSNRRVGFLGMSGFRADPVPAADWIPVRGELKSSLPLSIYSGSVWAYRPIPWDVPPRWVYVPSGTDLRKVDLDARTVTTVFETREPIVAPGVPALAALSSGHPTKEKPILVRTTQQILELDQQQHVLKVFTIPTEADRRSSVQWFDRDNGQSIAVFERLSSTGEEGSVSKRMVYRIAGDGAIQDQFELDLQTGSVPKQTQDLVGVLAFPAPAILFAVIPVIEVGIDQIKNYPAGLEALLENTWPAFSVVLALSLILAVVAWRRSRAFSLSHQERITWTVFVVLLGLPAFVGFLLYRRWPIRQPCPNCHANVPRDRVACAECGTRFPDPSLKGIEIFA